MAATYLTPIQKNKKDTGGISAAVNKIASTAAQAIGNGAAKVTGTPRATSTSPASTSNTGAIGRAVSNAVTTATQGIANAARNVATQYNGSSNSGGTTSNTAPVYSGSGNGSGGSGSGGSGGGSSRPAVRTDMDAGVPDNSGYNAWQVYQRYIDDLRNQANTAYNLNMERIRQAYDSNSRTLSDALNSTRNQLQSTYDRSARDVRDDAEQALRDSYINYMLSRKNLGQELSALGLNGGEAETTVGSLLNNYGNSRNTIEATRNKNISSLGEALQSGMSQAQQNYNTALQTLINNRLNAENAAENARQNLLANFASNISDLAISNEPYLNAISKLSELVSGVKTEDAAATNPYESTTLRQGVPFTPGEGNPYARFIAQAQMMRQGGSSDDDIKNYLFGSVGNDSSALAQIFAQLGLE